MSRIIGVSILCAVLKCFGVFDSPFDLRDGLKLVWVHHLLPIDTQMG